ncbi:MAG: single-stranded DNA-binding protein [Polyangiaceae bacterium]
MANGINKAILLGNIGNEPELQQFDTGPRLSFRLAASERWKDKSTGELKEHTEWFNIVLWGNRATALAKILEKGEKVMVEGRFQTRTFDNAKGETEYYTEVRAREIYLTGGSRRPDAAVFDSTEVGRRMAAEARA